MATHYDLQEQEQLATLKHFWDRWGLLISLVALAVVLVLAGFSGYRYWQARQASQAAVLYEQVRTASEQGQLDQAAQALASLQEAYPRTAQASQASLLAGALFAREQDWARAAQAYDWVSEKSRDAGFQALAVLRKASLLMEQGQFDAALTALDSFAFPQAFHGLREDRRGDVLQKMGRVDEAIAAYNAAYAALDALAPYRSVVEAKLNALGARAGQSAASA
ncbi:hypothetical protein AAV94_07330 [Lampropedia cohaerens]|uniref:Ancillary SecYEG translocon subunit n=1 Tax=Lampropedia cohaerens TaxID=1610491 RepID=A0A0U1Q041_9BURK|nr:tetratricopeptide repeat protein [Lampropedia cohaerens]KKW67975.1 hypothetical protein AAV94_07330 [Lampropedia cohaerens]